MAAANGKNARRIPHALTVDLEEYFQVSNFDGVIPRESWDQIPSRVDASVRQLLELFSAEGCRATFFALGWLAERRPALLREIADQGHEIACHGYGHELVYQLGPERFRADLRRARKAIEDATGLAVRGYRAPSFSITKQSLWALGILAEEGFAYDTSVFPIKHPRYGMPGFPPHPARIHLDAGLEIVEFPLTTLPWAGLSLPLAGGAYLRFVPRSVFEWGWSRLDRSSLPSVLYLHPWETDARQPRQRVGWRVRVNHYFNLRETLPRIGRLVGRFSFSSMAHVIRSLESAGALPRRTLRTGEKAPRLAQAS